MAIREYELENVVDEFYMFRKKSIPGWSERVREDGIFPIEWTTMGRGMEKDRLDLIVLDNLLGDKSKNFYFGYPVPTTRKSTKTIRMYINDKGMTDKEILKTDGDHKETIKNNSFEVYLVSTEVRGEGGRALKVFVTNDNKNYYLVDMREMEFYDYLLTVDVGDNARIDKNGKLFGRFKFFKKGQGFRLISESDKRLEK